MKSWPKSQLGQGISGHYFPQFIWKSWPKSDLALFIYIFQYLALFTYIYPHLALFALIWLYLPLIALIWPYMPYSPYINIILVRLHLCATF